MPRWVAILQSNYIPWKGYFDLINSVDELIVFDDVQYTRQDWRNRNRIKTAQGSRWLTIPVHVRGMYKQLIQDTQVSDPGWSERHLNALCSHYRRARFFGRYRRWLEELYLGNASTNLSETNLRFIRAICQELAISTTISRSGDYDRAKGRTNRLVSLCLQAGATHYLSGPSARAYLDAQQFSVAGLELAYMDYSGYPQYEQVHPPFDHFVTVLDLLLNAGPEARSFMKSPGLNRCESPTWDRPAPPAGRGPDRPRPPR